MPYADPDAQREYQRQWAQQRRSGFLADKTCEVCGRGDRLEVHHADPTQKLSHAVWSWSAKRRADELAKCEVVCRPCHERIHSKARRIVASIVNPCGTAAAYSRGCRCSACRIAHNANNQRLLREKREVPA